MTNCYKRILLPLLIDKWNCYKRIFTTTKINDKYFLPLLIDKWQIATKEYFYHY